MLQSFSDGGFSDSIDFKLLENSFVCVENSRVENLGQEGLLPLFRITQFDDNNVRSCREYDLL